MRRRPSNATPLLAAVLLTLALQNACGKRADPLAPWVKTPAAPSAFEVAQIGEEVEIRAMAPRTTTENRPLPVITLEWFSSAPLGDFGKGAKPLFSEEVAPGELRIKRFPRSLTDVRYSVRASDGRARSAFAAPVLVKPTPAPAGPTAVIATNTATGVDLQWTNPPGAEPWPPPPTPTPKPVLGALPGTPPTGSPVPGAPAPAPTPTPTPAPTPTPTPTPEPLPAAAPGAPLPPGAPVPSPSASPTPAPTPPTGIRIYRTDGLLRLAREPLQASSWMDTAVVPGTTACYSISYVASFKPAVESAPTEPVCVEIKDLVPPVPPARLLGDVGANFVELSWLASASADVDFYRLYRTTGAEPRALVVQTEGLLLRVRDNNMTPGPRLYEIIAVDKGGNESVPGPVLRIIVP